jgi:cob(I)alamin adenosyltransferase
LTPPLREGLACVQMQTIGGRRWRIGELAGVTGVSVRALRHYDEVGLLEPTERSSAGYRLYADAEVQRLYRILALRGLGMSLRQIRAVLDGDPPTLEETARRHLKQIEDELAGLERLRDRVARVLAALPREGEAVSGELIDAIEEMTMAIELTRIYTRDGDDGFTDLGEGTRVPKSDPRLAPDLEELNAQLGVALTLPGLDERRAALLRRLQNDLFDVGADLAVSPETGAGRPRLRITPDYVAWLEEACDELNERLEPLESFLLPGGNPAGAQLHVCRTVCRRLEREAVAVEGVNPEVVRYLNRLSDLLFILARAASDAPERLWQPGGGSGTSVHETPRRHRRR